MTTDHNEAMRLADALLMGEAMIPEIDLPEAAALLRKQATARALDTFAHNVLAGQARLQMVQLENKLQNVTAELDTLRAEVERLRTPLTDERICELWSWSATAEAERTATTQQHAFARAIEAAKEATP